MKLGLGSYAFYWSGGVPGWPQPAAPMTSVDLVEHAASLGLKLAQIADNMPVISLPAPDREALRDRSRDLGVEIELGARGIQGDTLPRHIDLCHYFDSRLLRIVVDSAGHHPEPAEVTDLLGPFAALLESAGVVLAVENHDRFPVATLAAIIRNIGSPNVGVCLDTVNSFGSLEGPAAVVDTLAPLVVNLHLKDFRIARASHMMGFTLEGTPACEGQLNVPWLLDRLRQSGRDVNAILELWPPPEENVEDTVRKEREWVARSVVNLRQLIRD